MRSLAIVSAAWLGFALAQTNPEATQPDQRPAGVAGEISGERVSHQDKQSDWPAIAYSRDGTLFAIYVQWNDKDADHVLVRRRSPDGVWSAPITLDDGSRDHYLPALISTGAGVLAVWSAQAGGNFELYSATVSADGRASKPERLTRAPFGDLNPALASDADGNVTLVWQSFRNGNADIFARKRVDGQWGPEADISGSPASDWEPAVALDSNGTAWICWDSYRHGNYDVFLRSWDGSEPGAVVAVTTEETAQFHSSVAVDSADRVWVAWDDSGKNWGMDFSRTSSAPGSRGLHHSRTVGLRVYSNGRVQNLSPAPDEVFTGRMRRYAELPRLHFDASGALWMVFRHWTIAKPHEMFHFYATRLEGSEWSLPVRLSMSAGRNSQLASMARNPSGGLSVAYSSDLRSEVYLPTHATHALHYNVYFSELAKAANPARASLTEAQLPPPGKPSPRRQRATMSAGGKTYTLMLGDCHRHTDIRGHSGVDASILDTYRYAIDAAQLDFLGTSDHNQVTGGRWPDSLRDYQWWFTQKAVDLFSHAPHFTGIYSYEHSMSRPGGHRNVLFSKRGAPLRPIDRNKKPPAAPDNMPPAMWAFWKKNVLGEPGQKSVIVPHTFAAGPLADWNWPNARFDCLLEIYQGARGSYEAWRMPDKEKRGPTQTDEPGHFAQDALAVGNTYGFVSFSDHGSTHNSWAAVWVEQEDREGILDAMYARHTYAASDEILMMVTADGHMVGEEWETSAGRAPRIRAAIEAPDTILRVDVVKDGKYVFTSRPNRRTATLDFRDANPSVGRSYYYVRVFQRDPEQPDGDPEIAWASPFYVTYH